MNTKNRYIIHYISIHITATFPFNIPLDNINTHQPQPPHFCSLPDGAKASRDGTAILRKILHWPTAWAKFYQDVLANGYELSTPPGQFMSVFGDLFGAQTSLTPDWRIQEVIGSIFGWLGCSNSEFGGALVGLSAVISTISKQFSGWSLPSFPPEIGKIT